MSNCIRQVIVGALALLWGVSLSAAEWKDPVSGNWTDSANWVDGTLPSSSSCAYITNKTGTASYTVTLDSANAQQTSGLNLQGKATTADNSAQLTYRAEFEVKSALAVSGDTSVTYGGRVTIPEGGSMNLSSGKATLGALGQLLVTGGSLTTENSFTGLSLGAGAYASGVVPKLSVSSGLVSLKSTASSGFSQLMNITGYGQLVMTGGQMTLSAPDVNKYAVWTQGNANNVQLSLSGDAELDVTKGMAWFGQGDVEVSGNAKLIGTGAEKSHFSFIPYYSDSNKKINVRLSGNSQVRATGYQYCQVGKNDLRTKGTTVNFEVSGGKHVFGYRSVFGAGSGTYTAKLTGGSVTYDGYGLWLGAVPLNPDQSGTFDNTTVMSVTNNGVLCVTANQCQNTSAKKDLWGFVIGHGICGTHSDYMFRGCLEICDGGIVTNGVVGAKVPIFVGAGYATGVVHQTGGTFYSAGDGVTTWNWDTGSLVLGLCGGYGAYEISGGTAVIDTPAWIGGCDLTSTLALGRTMENVTFPPDCAGKSVGVLKVSGGEMSISRHVYVGYDGKGVIDMSGDGKLTIGRNLVLSNSVSQAATLRFTLTDAAKPFLDCGGSMILSDGARLVVDASGCHEAGVKHQIFRSKNNTEAFAASQVELIDDGGGKLRFDKKGIWYCRPKGLLLIFR